MINKKIENHQNNLKQKKMQTKNRNLKLEGRKQENISYKLHNQNKQNVVKQAKLQSIFKSVQIKKVSVHNNRESSLLNLKIQNLNKKQKVQIAFKKNEHQIKDQQSIITPQQRIFDSFAKLQSTVNVRNHLTKKYESSNKDEVFNLIKQSNRNTLRLEQSYSDFQYQVKGLNRIKSYTIHTDNDRSSQNKNIITRKNRPVRGSLYSNNKLSIHNQNIQWKLKSCIKTNTIQFNDKTKKVSDLIDENNLFRKFQIVKIFSICCSSSLQILQERNTTENKQIQTQLMQEQEKLEQCLIESQQVQILRFAKKYKGKFKRFNQLAKQADLFKERYESLFKEDKNQILNAINKNQQALYNSTNQINQLQKKFYNEMNNLKISFKDKINRNRIIEFEFKNQIQNLQEQLICQIQPPALKQKINNFIRQFYTEITQQINNQTKSMNQYLVEYENIQYSFIFWTDCLKRNKDKVEKCMKQMRKLPQMSIELFGDSLSQKQNIKKLLKQKSKTSEVIQILLNTQCQICFNTEQKLKYIKDYNRKIIPIIKSFDLLKGQAKIQIFQIKNNFKKL